MSDPSNCLGPTKLETHFSDEMLRAIGLLLITAANCESALTMQLWRLSHHPNKPNVRSIMPLWGMETKVKLEKIAIAARFAVAGDSLKTVIRICGKLRGLYSRRNEFAHYVSATPDRRPTHIRLRTLRMKADGSMEKEKTYSVKHIIEYARLIHARTRQLDEVLNEAGVRKIPKSIELEAQMQADHPPQIDPPNDTKH